MDPKLFQEIECEERLPDLTDEELAELENSFDEFDRLASQALYPEPNYAPQPVSLENLF